MISIQTPNQNNTADRSALADFSVGPKEVMCGVTMRNA